MALGLEESPVEGAPIHLMRQGSKYQNRHLHIPNSGLRFRQKAVISQTSGVQLLRIVGILWTLVEASLQDQARVYGYGFKVSFTTPLRAVSCTQLCDSSPSVKTASMYSRTLDFL